MTTPTPEGYLTKAEAAARLGMSTKTLERRMKTEPLLQRVLRKGRQLLFPADAISAYFQLAEERGQL